MWCLVQGPQAFIHCVYGFRVRPKRVENCCSKWFGVIAGLPKSEKIRFSSGSPTSTMTHSTEEFLETASFFVGVFNFVCRSIVRVSRSRRRYRSRSLASPVLNHNLRASTFSFSACFASRKRPGKFLRFEGFPWWGGGDQNRYPEQGNAEHSVGVRGSFI